MRVAIALVAALIVSSACEALAQGIPNRSGVSVQGSQPGNAGGQTGYRNYQQFRRDWNRYEPDGQTTVFVPKPGSYPQGDRPRNIYVPKTE